MLRQKCLICEVRPRYKDSKYCHNCGKQLEPESRQKRDKQAFRYLVYQGNAVGLFKNGGNTYKPELLRRSSDRLPKSKTINLERYCPGFTRAQIKKMKRAIRILTG